MHSNAVVSSKGQVTLPAAMRAALGIEAGPRIQFEVRGKELVIKPELPISAYFGMLNVAPKCTLQSPYHCHILMNGW